MTTGPAGNLTIGWIHYAPCSVKSSEKRSQYLAAGSNDRFAGALREPNPLLEHLHSARIYLLGAMPEEYLLSIESARQALDVVPDSKLRSRIDDSLSSLIHEMSHESPQG